MGPPVSLSSTEFGYRRARINRTMADIYILLLIRFYLRRNNQPSFTFIRIKLSNYSSNMHWSLPS
ncbi:hypothetical protein QC762_0088610 [Podospora pseudocomata]|uniref:Uncharacterized protein n=1 Tax=Podospora pseudocomata TaxID=2093779 RepID=A0ABR0GDY0_9PEZI|nr:hypothetical protein QC762_0088610 [Podospora pseudocomata]